MFIIHEQVSHAQEALQKSEITIASLRQDLSTSNMRSEDLIQAAKIKHMVCDNVIS